MDMRKLAMLSSKSVSTVGLTDHWFSDLVEIPLEAVSMLLVNADDACVESISAPTTNAMIEFQCGG